MAKKDSLRSATKNLDTKKTREHNAVLLPSKQVPMKKIEGVRMLRSKWVAEIKHPEKKYDRIWLGSYATQEEAAKAYQLKRMEHENLKVQAIATDMKSVDDQEVVSAHVESDTSYFTTKVTLKHAVLLSSKQVPIKIEGVRMLSSKWVAEFKHPKKKYVRIWLGSFATQEEAAKVYQSIMMEYEKLKVQAIAKGEKSVDDQEVVSSHVESDAKSLSDDRDVAKKGIDNDDDQAKKDSLRSATKKLATKKTREHPVLLPSKQVPTKKIEGVRKRKSKWVAEIKHPKKKNVRIWHGSYATQEEAATVYQLKKMELDKLIEVQAKAKDKELVDNHEVAIAHVESNAKSLSDDRDVAKKGIDNDDQAKKDVVTDDQAMKAVDFNDQESTVNVLKEPKVENFNVQIWLGGYATQEEASKVYQLKTMEHEKLKLQAIARKDKLVVDQEVVSAHVESNAEPVSDDPNVMMEVVDYDDQAKKVVDIDDEKIVDILKESNDRVATMRVVDADDQAMKVVHFDDQAERSLSRGRVVEKEANGMLLQLGPILIDRYGSLLGDYRWIDDLSI